MLRRHPAKIAWVVAGLAIAGGMVAWSEHRPLLPGQTGCDLVRDFDSRSDCYAKVFEPLIRSADRDRFLAKLDAKASGDSRFDNTCHDAMHTVMRRLIVDQKIDPVTLVPQVTDSPTVCSGGVLHGLVENTYLDDRDAFIEIQSTICDKLPRADKVTCLEGIGHSMGHAMVRSEDTPQIAMDGCWDLEGNMIYTCLNGVFMEIATGIDSGTPTQAFNEVCEDARPKEHYICYEAAPLAWAYIDDEPSEAEAFEFCISQDGDLAASGCLTNPMFRLESSWLARCLKIENRPALVARCSFYLGRGATFHDEVPDYTNSCRAARSTALRFGCGAFLGQRALPDHYVRAEATAKDLPRVKRWCGGLDAAFRSGCRAYALGCWPNEIAPNTVPGHPAKSTCASAGMLPDDVITRIQDEPIPTYLDPDFTRWFMSRT